MKGARKMVGSNEQAMLERIMAVLFYDYYLVNFLERGMCLSSYFSPVVKLTSFV